MYDRIAVGDVARHSDVLAVIQDLGLALGGLVIGLGFDREETGLANQNMVYVEAVADEIVQHPITAHPQGFQELAHRSLAIPRQAQLPQLAPEDEQLAGNIEDNHDRYHGVQKWLRWKVQPPP